MGRSPRWGAVAIVARYNLFELRFIAQSHTNNPKDKDKTSPLPGGFTMVKKAMRTRRAQDVRGG